MAEQITMKARLTLPAFYKEALKHVLANYEESLEQYVITSLLQRLRADIDDCPNWQELQKKYSQLESIHKSIKRLAASSKVSIEG